MTRVQKLQIRQSELRTEMGALLDKEDRSDEDRTKLSELTREMRALEGDLQAALTIEQEPATETRETGIGEDAEGKELDGLLQRASILLYMSEAISGRDCDGVEHEVRAGLLGDAARCGLVPFEMLLDPEMERRADTATTVAAAARTPGSQVSVLQRVFTKSIAAMNKVSMPMVEVGQANFPILSAGTTATMVNAGTAKDATAATFTGFSLDPVRLSARYVFRYEDVAKLRNYESVLRRDLTAAMTDAMDQQVINGDGSAPNASGFLSELTAPSDPTAATTWNEWLKAHTDEVDGLNAYKLSDLIRTIGKASFSYPENVVPHGGDGQRAARERSGIRDEPHRWRHGFVENPGADFQHSVGVDCHDFLSGKERGGADLARIGTDPRSIQPCEPGRGRVDRADVVELQSPAGDRMGAREGADGVTHGRRHPGGVAVRA